MSAGPARELAAQFLVSVRGRVVAIDRMQPVAALYSTGGGLLDVASWADLAAPPGEWVWPNRRIGVQGDSVVVQDQLERPGPHPRQRDGPTVALDVGADGLDGVRSVEHVDVRWRYPRLFGVAPPAVAGWSVDGERTNDRWWSWVDHDGRRWVAGDGSVVAYAVDGSSALVSVRRAPVRPWAFRPRHDLVALRSGPDGLVATPLPPIDITARCWTPLPGGDQAFAEYLRWSERIARGIAEHGGSDVRLSHDGRNVDIRFTRDGRNHLLHDEPLDEVDRAVGLRFWGHAVDHWSAPPSWLVVP